MERAAPTPWSSYGKALLATFFWGCSFIAVRYALDSATPFSIVWLRNAMGAAFLYALLALRREPLWPAREDRGRVILLGLLFGAHLLAQTYALQRTAAMRAGWIIAFIPAIVAVGAWLFMRQRMRVVGWFGIVLASTGVLILTATRPARLAEAGTGDLIMLGTTFSWAAYTLLCTGAIRRNGALRVSAGALLVSVLPNLIASFADGSWHAAPSASAIAALVFLGIGASGTAMWLYSDVLAELGPERSSAFQYVQPLVTMAAAFLLLHEEVTSEQLIGGPVILAGVWLVQRGKRVT